MTEPTVPAASPRPENHSSPLVACIGASAGGLEALEAFFAALPSTTGIAWVVVVHLSPHFKSLMPELIGRRTAMKVRAVEDGVELRADQVFIIPPSQNLVAKGGRLKLSAQDRQPGHGLHLPIDICLRSMALELGSRCVCIILSGTGSDGSRGARLVKDRGGVVFTQSPREARFDGMPHSAIQTGIVDLVAPVRELAERTAYLAQHAQSILQRPIGGDDDEPDHEDRFLTSPEQLAAVLQHLQRRGFDLSYMRSSTVHRRVKRRAALQGVTDPLHYLKRLEESESEVETLAHDLLVGVTSFFRDPEVFEALRHRVFPEVVRRSSAAEPIRIWIPGCSTGQEVYTVAMCLLEALENAGLRRDFRIFATDLNGEALKHASRGEYTASELQDVPKTLGTRYIEYRSGALSVNAALRKSVIFALHNLVKDPPFTRIDFLSCRNLLIYLKPEARQRVMNSILSALKPDSGILLLGQAESTASVESHFTEVDGPSKIYRRTHRAAPIQISSAPAMLDPVRSVVAAEPMGRKSYLELRAAQDAKMLRAVLENSFEGDRRSAALVDQANRLLEVLTDPLSLFRLRKGRPSDDLALLLPGPFSSALLSARSRLSDTDEVARVMVVGADAQGVRYELSLQQIAVGGAASRTYLLLIREQEEVSVGTEFVSGEEHSEQVSDLLVELSRTKERLNSTIEQLQSTNEEQQSTNEELIASNEELQSTNEELQSLNEELYTVNVEFQRKNEELQVAHADLDNLLTHLTVATLFLDRELLIRKFNPSIGRVVTLQPRDIGRSIKDFNPRIEADLFSIAEQVLSTGELIEQEFLDRDELWLQMRAHPYIGPQGQESGVLMTFVDVSRIKDAEARARSVSENLTATNNRLRDQAQQLEELFSMVAHDLRRPLLAVDGMVTLALEALDGKSDPRAFMERAKARVDNLRRVLRDLSDFVRLNHEEPAVATVNLVDWLEELMRPYVSQAKSEGVRLHYTSDGSTARFAESLAGMMVRNLVDNALTHGSSGSEPEIDVQCFVDASMMVLSVRDNGEGIAPEHHARVFELFRRLRPEESEGTGVGLTAVRRLTERAGGTIRLESDVGAGVRITVRLPVQTATPADLDAAPMRLVFVTEDSDLATSVQKSLAIEVVRVDPNEESVRAAVQDGVEIVLVEPGFPEGRGLRVLPTIREFSNRALPIILVSGELEDVDTAELEEFNVRGYIDLRSMSSFAKLGDLVKSTLAGET